MWRPRNAQSYEEAALSQHRSESTADLDHLTSGQDICRQRGAEIALEQLTLPAHPSGTRFCTSLGESFQHKANCFAKVQSLLIATGENPLQHLPAGTARPFVPNIGVDFLFATIN